MGSEMKNFVSTLQSMPPDPARANQDRRLWFEFGTTAVVWHILNAVFAVISWRACVHQEQFGGPHPDPVARAFYFLVWGASAGLTLFAGIYSYRSWRKLSDVANLLCAEGRERREFMSLSGLFISVTLGCGFLWLCLPLFLIQLCMRTR